MDQQSAPAPHQLELPAFSAVGVAVDCIGGDNSAIGAAWDSFFKAAAPEEHEGVLAVMWGIPGGFRYLAAYRLNPERAASFELPAGWERRDVPVRRYAVWSFHDNVSQMGPFWHAILNEGLAAAGLSRSADGLSLELYPAEGAWDPATQTMRADMYIALGD